MPMYSFEMVGISNEDTCGRCVTRRRMYCVASLVAYYRLERPLSELASVLGRTRNASHTSHEYFQADASELRSELRWGLSRKAGRSHGPTHGAAPDLSPSTAFEDSLVPWEHNHLLGARALGPGLMYTLA